jgi:hypothetical protein
MIDESHDFSILYLSDEAGPAIMGIQELFAIFTFSETGFYADDILNDLNSRGFYEGVHINGRYCIVNLKKLAEAETARQTIHHMMER